MSEKKFAQGILFKRPNEKAPAFVKGNISVKVSEFVPFLQENQNNDWVNLDLLVSKDEQKLYFTLNSWKPESKEKPEEIVIDKIPF